MHKLLEKTHLKFCCIYIDNVSFRQKMRFMHLNGFILEACHICTASLIIILTGNTNNSKLIKKVNKIILAPSINPLDPRASKPGQTSIS